MANPKINSGSGDTGFNVPQEGVFIPKPPSGEAPLDPVAAVVDMFTAGALEQHHLEPTQRVSPEREAE